MNKLLLLTDHSSHTPTDSIFKLAEELSKYFDIWIVSRSTPENMSFFQSPKTEKVIASNWNQSFAFNSLDVFFSNHTEIEIKDSTMIFLRLDAPVLSSFLSDLKSYFPATPIINDPSGVILSRKRSYIMKYQELTLPSIFASSIKELLEFVAINDSVIKLDDSYGGSGVIKVAGTKRWKSLQEIPEPLLIRIKDNIFKHNGVFVQEFTKNVVQGDKRILIAFGKVIGAVLRKPKDGDWRCNIALGGSWEISSLSPYEEAIANTLAKDLEAIGVVIFGVDILQSEKNIPVISELNVSNVGGFLQAENSSFSPSKFIAKEMFEYAQIKQSFNY